jgi:hypothetical protein
LSKPKRQPNPTSKAEVPPAGTGGGFAARVQRTFGKLRAWAAVHWLRGVMVAGTILLLIATTMAAWAYLASVALRAGQPTLDAALNALDERRFDEARTTVNKLLSGGRLPRSEYGGPLYVLGAIKTHDAENQTAPNKRRTEYLVASRYLHEASSYRFPTGRELHGLFLLGKSLVESSQFEDGIRVLDEELLSGSWPGDDALRSEAHRILSNTCLWMPYPRPDKALEHTDALLQDASLSDAQRTEALLHRAACLARLARFDDARQVQRSPEVPLGRPMPRWRKASSSWTRSMLPCSASRSRSGEPFSIDRLYESRQRFSSYSGPRHSRGRTASSRGRRTTTWGEGLRSRGKRMQRSSSSHKRGNTMVIALRASRPLWLKRTCSVKVGSSKKPSARIGACWSHLPMRQTIAAS